MLKFHNCLIIFMILLYDADSEAGKIKILCPDDCVCELYEGLRKASCVQQKMVDLKDNLPMHTQLLDFSYNYVSSLKENEFIRNGLTHLKLLDLSHNKIGDIHIYAFNEMKELKLLDLSHNALQYILKQWFWNLPNLEELYLNNNNLGQFKTGPIFESMSLKILNLASCGIPYLSNDAFSQLKSLQQLDLSGNYLIDMNYQILSDFTNLQSIMLVDNSIVCNNNFEEFISYCKEQQISYDHDFCKDPESGTEEKFQRMVVQPDIKRNSWMVVDEDLPTNVTCPSLEESEKNILIEIAEMSPVITAILLVTFGFFVGVIFGCSCQIHAAVKQEMKPIKRQFSVIRKTVGADRHSLLLNAENCFESTPMMDRRSMNFY